MMTNVLDWLLEAVNIYVVLAVFGAGAIAWWQNERRIRRERERQ